MILQGFIGGAYLGRSKAIDSQECINLYPEIEQQSSKNVIALLGTPGLSSFSVVTPGAGTSGRGMFYSPSTGRLIVVTGDTVAEISTTGTVTSRGTLGTSTGPVRYAENANNEVIIVDGTSGWILDLSTNVLTEISDPAFPATPTHVGFISGYFIVNQGDTGNFFWSAQDDGTSWAALDSANAEGSPDGLKGLIVNRNELWLIGESTMEVWAITAASSSSERFQRIPGTLRNRGSSAANSIMEIHDHNFWLGATQNGYGIVWMSVGYEPQRISTSAIEYQIRSYSTISDAVGFTYQFEGHVFYILTFPTANVTWVYDISTQLWHQWSYNNSGAAERTRALYQAFFNGNNYVQDHSTGQIYQLDLDTYTDNGAEIRRVRSSPHVHADQKRISYAKFEVDIESGTGLTSGQGNDPQMMLQISNDGGYTWGSELWTDMGAKGKYKTRTEWHRLGRSRDRVFRVTITDPIKVVLINAVMEIRDIIMGPRG